MVVAAERFSRGRPALWVQFPCVTKGAGASAGFDSRAVTPSTDPLSLSACPTTASPSFEREVLRKRPYLRREWCIGVVEAPVRVERQEDNRYRFWAMVPELGNRYLRVVTLDDKVTIHNAFPDRGFRL